MINEQTTKIALIGAGCSVVSERIAKEAKTWNLVMVSERQARIQTEMSPFSDNANAEGARFYFYVILFYFASPTVGERSDSQKYACVRRLRLQGQEKEKSSNWRVDRETTTA